MTKYFVKRFQPHLLLAIMISAGWLVAVAAPAEGETRKIGGLTFQVEEITAVDRSAVRVVVDGETQIVPRDQVDDFIISKKLESPDWAKGFSLPSLMGFAKEGLRIRKYDRAREVLRIIIGNDELSEVTLEGFLAEMLKVPAGISIIQETLKGLAEKDESGPHVVSMILTVGRYDSPWIRANLLKYCFSHRDEIFRRIDSRFQEAIAVQDFKAAQGYWKLASDVYGHADEKVQQIQLIYNKLKLARRALASGEVEQLYPLIPLTLQSDDLRKFLSPILLNAFHQEGRRSLSRGGNSRVLNIMTQIPFELRTVTTYELVRDALKSLKPSPKSVLLEEGIWSDVKRMGGKSPQIQEAASTAILTQIKFFLENRGIHQIDPFLERLKVFRPDPNEENDKIRLQQALLFKELGDSANASRKLDEMSNLGLAEYSFLLHSGYYIDLYLLMIIGLFPAVVAILYKIFARLTAPEKGEEKEGDDEEDEEEEIAPGGFSYISLKRGLSPRMHEYVGLLRKFELGPEASMKVIKAAYRSAVKEVHPDLHADSANTTDEKDAEEFRVLNERYERIIELRKNLGYPEK